MHPLILQQLAADRVSYMIAQAEDWHLAHQARLARRSPTPRQKTRPGLPCTHAEIELPSANTAAPAVSVRCPEPGLRLTAPRTASLPWQSPGTRGHDEDLLRAGRPCGGLPRTLILSAVNRASKELVNWPARSLIRNLTEAARCPRSIRKLRPA